MVNVRGAPKSSRSGNTFLLFNQRYLEAEWLAWSKPDFRKVETLGTLAAFVLVNAAAAILTSLPSTISCGTLVLVTFADVVLSVGAWLAPRLIKDYDLVVRTPLYAVLRILWLPALGWGLVSSVSKDVPQAVWGNARLGNFATFFFPAHLLLGTFRFPLRYREHVLVQILATLVSGCLSGFFCTGYFESRDDRSLIGNAGSSLALASTGLNIPDLENGFTASCMTLSLQLQALLGVLPTLVVVYWAEWQSRLAFLEGKGRCQTKRD